MKESRGYVKHKDAGATAQVMIRRGERAEACTSHAEQCHCKEEGDALVLKADNRAGANVGDYVSVVFKPGAVLKSLLVLIGLPSVGILAGLVAGTMLSEKSAAPSHHAFFVGVACFALSVLTAVLIYRGIGSQLRPFIDRVIVPGAGAGLVFHVDPVCGRAVDPAGPGATVEFEGRTYRFCGAGCLGAFVKEPERYAALRHCAQCGN